MSVTRSTISFDSQNWLKIADVKNRSKVVNQALQYFFASESFIKAKKEEFLLQELQDYYNTPSDGQSFEEVFGETL